MHKNICEISFTFLFGTYTLSYPPKEVKLSTKKRAANGRPYGFSFYMPPLKTAHGYFTY